MMTDFAKTIKAMTEELGPYTVTDQWGDLVLPEQIVRGMLLRLDDVGEYVPKDEKDEKAKCRHDWWCVPGERFKSNPEQIIITCMHCDARIQAKVANHWSELEERRS